MHVNDRGLKAVVMNAMCWLISRLVFADESVKLMTVKNRENSQLYSVQRQ
jgi:hypothetical protein